MYLSKFQCNAKTDQTKIITQIDLFKRHCTAKASIAVLAFLLSIFSFTSMALSANLNEDQCKFFRGIWTGSASGSYGGAMKMEVNQNCSYKISGQFRTPGRLTFNKKRSSYEYVNQLGSRGIVEVNGQTLRMWNAYTGNNYQILWKRQN